MAVMMYVRFPSPRATDQCLQRKCASLLEPIWSDARVGAHEGELKVADGFALD